VPGVVGIDGGYLRDWEHKQTHFVAIVGKSVPIGGEARSFGFVDSQDPWPRRRLTVTLRAQRLRSGPKLAFLSDGEDGIRSLQRHISPRAQHMLDWFHLAMRLQQLRQLLVGLTHLDPVVGAQMQTALERTKWSLWHGKSKQPTRGSAKWNGGLAIRSPLPTVQCTGPRCQRLRALHRPKRVHHPGLRRPLACWSGDLYGVHRVVGQLAPAKRFAKKQSMQWTPVGAHLLLQIRTRALNGVLASTFRHSYPDFSVAEQRVHPHFLAA
jgi:hypothetical protein